MARPTDEATDAELACMIADPSVARQAFKVLYDRHGASLLALVTSRYPKVAEEICQETWLRVFDNLRGGPRPMPNFRGWVWTIARNMGAEHYRVRSTAYLQADQQSNLPEPPALLETREREAVMRRCFETLGRQRPEYAAVVAAFLDGEPPVQASLRLGISRANFDQRKKRAIDALQQCVESRLA